MAAISANTLYLGPDVASRGRWLSSALLGMGLGLGGIVASYALVTAVFGPVEGLAYGWVGVVQALLVPLAVWIGLRPAGISLDRIGLRGPRLARDAMLGLVIAGGFAILQFTLLIPATGGAAREDVVMNLSQIGGSWEGVVGFIVLAWTGGFAEELLFRGLLLVALRNAFGKSGRALVLAALTTVIVFALLHGYQGWAGILDTGLYGGVILTALFLATDGRLTACVVAHAGWNTFAVLGLHLLWGGGAAG